MRAAVLRIGVALFALVVVSATTVSARAQDIESARAHFERGKAFYNLAKWQEALQEFEKAYLDKQDPLFLFNIAQCHRQAGNNVEALRFYKNYLREIPDRRTNHRIDVEKRVRELEELIASEAKLRKAPPRDVEAPQPAASPAIPEQATAPASETAVAQPEAPPTAEPVAAAVGTEQLPITPLTPAPAESGVRVAPATPGQPWQYAPQQPPRPRPTAATALQGREQGQAEVGAKPVYAKPAFWLVLGGAALLVAGVVAFVTLRADPSCPRGYSCL